MGRSGPKWLEREREGADKTGRAQVKECEWVLDWEKAVFSQLLEEGVGAAEGECLDREPWSRSVVGGDKTHEQDPGAA